MPCLKQEYHQHSNQPWLCLAESRKTPVVKDSKGSLGNLFQQYNTFLPKKIFLISRKKNQRRPGFNTRFSLLSTPKPSNNKNINKTEERRQTNQSNSPKLEVTWLSLAKDKDLG